MMTNNLQVTMLAWYLDVPIMGPGAANRKFSTKPGPNVVFQDATSTGAKAVSDESADAGMGTGVEAEERLAVQDRQDRSGDALHGLLGVQQDMSSGSFSSP